MRPQKRQPTRLPRPWDSPGVGCHFLLQRMKVKIESEVTQLCLTPSDPMDCSLPGSSIHRIFQARVLEWGAIAFSITLPICQNILFSCIRYVSLIELLFWNYCKSTFNYKNKQTKKTRDSTYYLQNYSTISQSGYGYWYNIPIWFRFLQFYLLQMCLVLYNLITCIN